MLIVGEKIERILTKELRNVHMPVSLNKAKYHLSF